MFYLSNIALYSQDIREKEEAGGILNQLLGATNTVANEWDSMSEKIESIKSISKFLKSSNVIDIINSI